MISQLVMTRVRHLLLTIAALFKKLLCCFSRRRRSSAGSGPGDTLSSVNVVRDSSRYKNVVEKDWNSWDDTPATVEEHIERYREKLVAPVSPPEPPPEEQIDFFQDMAPKIVAQTKICIAATDGGQSPSQFARLTASNIDIPVGDGLDDWEDEEGGRGGVGWDDADENTTKQLIRETRKELRHQRQQQARSHQHYQK
uniref:Putative estrogen receptor binding site associated antigen 9 n=2 Tax=Culex tarsalis TaxID=7177 RepID=A0A1Q3FC60_CULTA